MERNFVKNKFIALGKNMKILAILSIVHSIMILNSFATFFDIFLFEDNIGGFSASFNPIVLFYAIINYISAISLFITYFYFIKIRNLTKKINKDYNNISLRSFNSYFSSSVMMNVIGLIGYIITVIIFLWRSILRLNPTNYTEEIIFLNNINQNLMFMLIGSLIGSILEIMSWVKLDEFFRENIEIFPESIRQNIIIGSSRIKIGSAFSLFEIFSFIFIPFLGLGAIVGCIFYIKGFLDLDGSLSELGNPDIELSEISTEIITKKSITQPGLEKLSIKIDRVVEKIEKISTKMDEIEDLIKKGIKKTE